MFMRSACENAQTLEAKQGLAAECQRGKRYAREMGTRCAVGWKLSELVKNKAVRVLPSGSKRALRNQSRVAFSQHDVGWMAPLGNAQSWRRTACDQSYSPAGPIRMREGWPGVIHRMADRPMQRSPR